nr:transposase [Acholeplasma granularum]
MDDFSIRKRYTYGTILINQDTGQSIDMIFSREVSDVAEFLKQFKSIKYITRDGSKSYRAAINEALPNAIQISDRFHLIKGLAEALNDDVKRNFNYFIINIKREQKQPTSREIKPISNKEKRIIEILKTYNENKNFSKTAKIHNIDRRTLSKYVKGEYSLNLKRNRNSFLKGHEKEVRALYERGLKKTVMVLELRKLGYKGNRSNLAEFIKKYIEEKDKSIIITKIKRQKLVNLLFDRGLSDLGLDSEDLNLMKKFIKENTLAKLILKISLEFRILLFSKRPNHLDEWLDKYDNIKELSNLKSFIRGTRLDIEAVKNSIIYDESNGKTEGVVNKIKNKKRIMYGRCKFSLLRSYFFNTNST